MSFYLSSFSILLQPYTVESTTAKIMLQDILGFEIPLDWEYLRVSEPRLQCQLIEELKNPPS